MTAQRSEGTLRGDANEGSVVGGNNSCNMGAVAITVGHRVVIGTATVVTDKVCTVCDLATRAKTASQSWVL